MKRSGDSRGSHVPGVSWFANPLVARFAWTGFRRGKGSFHFTTIAAIFVLIVVVNSALWMGREGLGRDAPYAEFRDFCESLFYQLVGFNALVGLLLGSLRVYTIVMREKTEETLESLRLSGLRPVDVIRGFALGLQIPAWVVFLASLPILWVCYLGGGVDAETLLTACALFIVVCPFATMLAVWIGLTFDKRVGDSFVGLSIVFAIFGTTLFFSAAQREPAIAQWVFTLHPAAWVATAVTDQIGGIFWFSLGIAPAWVGVPTYAVLAYLVYRSAARVLVAADRYRPTLAGAAALFTVFLILVHGLYEPNVARFDVSRAVQIVGGLVLMAQILIRRIDQGERYLLERSPSPDAPGYHPFSPVGRWFLVLGAALAASDALLAWRSDDEFSTPLGVFAALAPLVPLLAILLLIQAWELPDGVSNRVASRGLFWLVSVVPVVLGVVAGSVDAEGVAFGIASLSPIGLGGLLSISRFAAGHEAALVAGFYGSLVVWSIVGGLAWRVSNGFHRTLEANVKVMAARGVAARSAPRQGDGFGDAGGGVAEDAMR